MYNNIYTENFYEKNIMDTKTYIKFLKDRINSILQALENLKNRLDAKEIDYPAFLYLENNMYQSLIMTQNELYYQKK